MQAGRGQTQKQKWQEQAAAHGHHFTVCVVEGKAQPVKFRTNEDSCGIKSPGEGGLNAEEAL